MAQGFATVLAAALLACPLVSVLAADESPPGDVTRGRQGYNDYGCWQCHGSTGAGGGWQGPKLAPNLIPYPAFFLQVRTPRGNMPHYPERLLSDAAIADMYAYLRSIPVGPGADRIELLKK
jgi:mono/diheme cytochrome c family protein